MIGFWWRQKANRSSKMFLFCFWRFFRRWRYSDQWQFFDGVFLAQEIAKLKMIWVCISMYWELWSMSSGKRFLSDAWKDNILASAVLLFLILETSWKVSNYVFEFYIVCESEVQSWNSLYGPRYLIWPAREVFFFGSECCPLSCEFYL